METIGFGPVEETLAKLKAENAHSCAGYDASHNVRHVDCLSCGEVVTYDTVDYDADTRTEQRAFEPAEGGQCAECDEVFCNDHLTQSVYDPERRRLCRSCDNDVRDRVSKEIRTGEAAYNAVSAMRALRAALKDENDVTVIREVIATDIHKLNDEFEAINRELMPNIERAMGQQNNLPGIAA